MVRYVTVSVKAPVEVKEKLEKFGIKPSEILKKTINEELKMTFYDPSYVFIAEAKNVPFVPQKMKKLRKR